MELAYILRTGLYTMELAYILWNCLIYYETGLYTMKLAYILWNWLIYYGTGLYTTELAYILITCDET